MVRRCPTCGRSYAGRERYCSIDGSPLLTSTPPAAGRGGRDDPLLGNLIADRYRIVARLGEGGTSIVYLASREAVGDRVAIKFLKEDLTKRVGSVERFIIEARASSRIDHPHIVSVFDFGRDDEGHYYLVMEYVEGRSLIKHIKACRGFLQERAVEILRQLLMAVGAAHAEGIVHRDLKPENVICAKGRTGGDFVKVLDFGLAKFVGDGAGVSLTRHGVILGTPYYISPEQARAEKVDNRTDLYSVGVMAYEMLTGRVPFRGSNAVTVINRHISSEPKPFAMVRPDLEIHPELEQLVLSLLAKSPSGRFQTAEETLEALARVREKLAWEGGRKTPIEVTQTIEATPTSSAVARQTATTIWEAPGLLEDSSRLARLWDERMTAVADRFWGAGQWPQQVVESTAHIEALEARIGAHERTIATHYARIEAIENDVREREAAIRFERLDLVAYRCVIHEAISGGVELGDADGLTERLEQLGLSQDELLAQDPDRFFAVADELDQAIDVLDRRARKAIEARRGQVAEHQRAIHTEINRVWKLRQQAIPYCARLVGILQATAANRRELTIDVTAVAEVAGAIQIYQSVLMSVRPPTEADLD